MNVGTIVSMIGILTGLIALYNFYDFWRKRQSTKSIDIVTSAIQLLEPYKEEVTYYREIVANLTKELALTQKTAREVTKQLGEAQVEISFLRLQIKKLSEGL